MEFRVNNKSSGHGRIVEVCIDDQQHEATSAIIENSFQSPQDISIQVDSTSVMVVLSEQSIPNDKIISWYDLLCTTSALSDGQIHEVKVPNISASTTSFKFQLGQQTNTNLYNTSTTRIQVSGLLPGTAYKCCVNAHLLTNTPFDLISSSCATTETESLQEPNRTKFDKVPGCDDDLAIGLGTGVGLLLVVVCVGSIFINAFLVMRLKNSTTTNLKPPCTNE